MSQTAQLDLELKGYMEARFGKVGIDLMEATHERFQKPKALECRPLEIITAPTSHCRIEQPRVANQQKTGLNALGF